MKSLYLILLISTLISCQTKKAATLTLFNEAVKNGENAIKVNDLLEATKHFENAIKIDRKIPDGYYGLGVVNAKYCFKDSTHCNDAITYLNKAKSINDSYRRIYYNLAVCKIKMGFYNDALPDLNKAITLDSTDGDYFANRGSLYLKLGNTQNACKDWKKAIQLGSGNSYIDSLLEEYCK